MKDQSTKSSPLNHLKLVKPRMRFNLANNRGQTLVEAVVAFGIAIIVIVALVAATSIAVKRSKTVNFQTQARGYAQEGMEWIRAERDNNGWDALVLKAGDSGNPQTYCIYQTPISLPANPGCGSCASSPPGLGDNHFSRSATLLLDTNGSAKCQSPDCMVVTITVYWWENTGICHRSEQTTYLTKPQQ